MPITTTITHQALMRALRLSITAFGVPRVRSLRIRPISEASTRIAPIPPNNIRVWLSMSGMLRGEGEQGVAGAGEEQCLVFAVLQLQRCAEAGGAQQWQRQHAALGHDPVEVGDPHRDQLRLWITLG